MGEVCVVCGEWVQYSLVAARLILGFVKGIVQHPPFSSPPNVEWVYNYLDSKLGWIKLEGGRGERERERVIQLLSFCILIRPVGRVSEVGRSYIKSYTV